MDEEEIIITWNTDKTITIVSNFSKRKTIDKLIIIGSVLEDNLGIGITFICNGDD